MSAPVLSNVGLIQKPNYKEWLDYAKEERDRVSPHLFEIGDDLGCPEGFRVPASDYISREAHEREVAHLWRTVWQMACRVNDIPEVGDYLEYEIAGLSILVVRDTQTTFKAFRNACRHRAAALVSGRGNAPCFVCPFHGWTYALDGSLQHIPAAWDFSHFDGRGLLSVRIDEFNGNLFVTLDDEAPPLTDFIGARMMRHFEAHPDTRMWKSWHFGMIVEANWKVLAETFFEGYHSPITHSEFAAGAGDVQGRVDVFGLHHRLIVPTFMTSVTSGLAATEQEILDTILEASGGFVQTPDGEDIEARQTLTLPPGQTARAFMAETIRGNWAAQGLDLSDVSDTEIVDLFSNFIFPNFVSFVGPGGHITYRFRPNGDDHESMIFDVANLTPIAGDGPLPKDAPLQMIPRGSKLQGVEAVTRAMGATAVVFDQDVAISEKVQKGLKVADEIIAGATLEPNIFAFHRNLAAWIAGRAGSETVK